MTLVPPQHVDNDGDGYDDPEPAPMPDPGQVPGPAPDPAQVPAPDPAQVPVVLTVGIIRSFGTAAFMPNPLQASIGSSIVWTNGDVIAHAIVLDDGRIVGNLAPGQSSLPIPLTSATASYHCTIHASMVGQITDPAAVPPPASPDQPQNPAPDPSANPAPPSDPYSDPYDYLRFVR